MNLVPKEKQIRRVNRIYYQSYMNLKLYFHYIVQQHTVKESIKHYYKKFFQIQQNEKCQNRPIDLKSKQVIIHYQQLKSTISKMIIFSEMIFGDFRLVQVKKGTTAQGVKIPPRKDYSLNVEGLGEKNVFINCDAIDIK